MIGATLYLVGRDMSTGKIMSDANSCTMCKRLIINAGIEKVIIRRDTDTYDTVNVHDWWRMTTRSAAAWHTKQTSEREKYVNIRYF